MTPDTGFTIALHSREYLVSTLAEKIQLLVEDEALRSRFSQNAIAHARQFEWEHKADQNCGDVSGGAGRASGGPACPGLATGFCQQARQKWRSGWRSPCPLKLYNFANWPTPMD
ncbi:hypothetical protein [Thermoleptolyngbya sp.]